MRADILVEERAGALLCGITFGWIVRNAEIDGVRRLAVIRDVVVAAPEARAGFGAVVGGSEGAGTDGVREFVDALRSERAEGALLSFEALFLGENGAGITEDVNGGTGAIE